MKLPMQPDANSAEVRWKSSCSLKWDCIIYGYKLEGQKPFLIHHSFPWSGVTAKTRRMEQSLAHKSLSTSEYFHALRTNSTSISVRNISTTDSDTIYKATKWRSNNVDGKFHKSFIILIGSSSATHSGQPRFLFRVLYTKIGQDTQREALIYF